jgi:HSP20 family protein
MNLVRYRPLGGLVNFQRDLDSMVQEFFQHDPNLGAHREAWAPSVDVAEDESGYRLVAELPGVNKDDVKISLTEGLLTIRGEKKSAVKNEGETWHRVERSYGSFERSFRLTAPVDAGKVKARYENGVLTVLVPKAEEAKPREISIDW